MKTIQISIPDMQSAHCQVRVQNALSNIEGIHVNGITAGQATVAVNDAQQQSVVTAAIEKAGYTVAGIASGNDPQPGAALQFKTNINCGGCVASVRPALDGNNGIAEWHVDTLSKDKILTVKTAGATPEDVINTVKNAGFKIEPVL
ncbi:heavy-metal-associated domain-containing protein [Niabella sp. CC-SYL272]|uniref:heavy-metal-associated domain-containing protein n=1 Tax=Niabella agricola TaxID=2891571 RepID=UPI001F24942E|nr:heavy-metal-associated domain-containing protein [Niabella agricola]MCF3107950.1 heavy-metal-associated domain-containing protein [Niabella agricola]